MVLVNKLKSTILMCLLTLHPNYTPYSLLHIKDFLGWFKVDLDFNLFQKMSALE
jgi:hypothetical protein